MPTSTTSNKRKSKRKGTIPCFTKTNVCLLTLCVSNESDSITSEELIIGESIDKNNILIKGMR